MGSPHKVRASTFLNRRLDSKGLRPRVAASVLATFWLTAIFAFGLVMHLVDRDNFSSYWDGAWWATQTVTTVGYGDIVPTNGPGQFVAAVLMVGGLSFFAVITGLITTEFVTRADAERRKGRDEALDETLGDLKSQLTAIREQLAALSPERAGEPPPASPPPEG